jgi:hypothetical protein
MNKRRIADLLTSGLRPGQVASIVGVTPARISQLLKDDTELQNLVAEFEAAAREQDTVDKNMEAKELAARSLLLDQIMGLASTSELRDVTNAYRAIAEVQKLDAVRKNPIAVGGGSTIVHTHVSVSLPAHAIALPTLTLNAENEVTAIGNRSLAPLSSKAVESLFASFSSQNKPLEHIDHDPDFLPASSGSSPGEALPSSHEASAELITQFMDSRDPAPYAPRL